MYKVKVILTNLVYMALLGLFIQVVWVLFCGDIRQLNPSSIGYMMFFSSIIGTVCLFVIFYVTLKNMGSLVRAIITNIIIVFPMYFAIYLETGITLSQWSIGDKWIIIAVIGTFASIILTAFWYRKIKAYNSRLEMKKSSLQGKGGEEQF